MKFVRARVVAYYTNKDGITYLITYSSVHGKHDGANFKSAQHSKHKLHTIILAIFPILTVQIDL